MRRVSEETVIKEKGTMKSRKDDLHGRNHRIYGGGCVSGGERN